MRKEICCKRCGFREEIELMKGVKEVVVYSDKEEYESVGHPKTSTITRCKGCGAIMAIDQLFEMPEPYSIPNHCHPLV